MLILFKNHVCVKTVVAIIFIQINNKAHFRQKLMLILLQRSQCLPEINSFHVFFLNYMLSLLIYKVFYIFVFYFQVLFSIRHMRPI